MASLGPARPPRGERAWRTRLLHGEWRLWDLAFFHVLAAAVDVATALLAAATVVAMTKGDGDVKLSVLFVASLVATLVFVRSAVRAGLRTAERRTASAAAAAARRTLLDAVAQGTYVRPGVVGTFVTKSSASIGEYLSRAVPARAVALPLPLVVLGLLGWIDPWSALVAGAVAVAAPVALIAVGRRAAAEAEAGLGRLRSLATRALELLAGAVELRALGAVARGRQELEAATQRAVASTRRSLRLGLRSATVLDVLAGAAVGLVAMVDGFRLLGGSMGLGHALAAVLLTVEVFVPLRAAGTAFHAAADGRAALAVLDGLGDPPPHEASPSGSLPPVAASPAIVSARGVALGPARDAPLLLRDVDLVVEAGGSLVVRGPTGSGKSTLLRALAGQPLVRAGALRVGNADPARLSPRQRSALLAMVDQRPLLVAGTLRENLVLGRRADDDLLHDAVARCGLHELLSRAPRGLDTQVGEGGRLLSAGERTRVALARSVLRDPGVLLLDEVGAHLDDDALAALRAALGRFLHARTVIEAAHDRPLLAGVPVLDLGVLEAVR